MSNIDFTIAGIGIRISSPVALSVPREMEPFLTPEIMPSVFYDVQLIDSPVSPAGVCVHSEAGTSVYADPEGWLRIYAYLEGADGVQAALRLRSQGRHTLYLPKKLFAK